MEYKEAIMEHQEAIMEHPRSNYETQEARRFYGQEAFMQQEAFMECRKGP